MPNNIPVNIDGAHIRKLRKERGFRNVESFAKALGLSDTTHLYKIERSEAQPSLSLLYKIAILLDVSVADLLTEHDTDSFASANAVLRFAQGDVPAGSLRSKIKEWLNEHPEKIDALKAIVSVNRDLNVLFQDAYDMFCDAINFDCENLMITVHNKESKEPITMGIPPEYIQPIIMLIFGAYVTDHFQD